MKLIDSICGWNVENNKRSSYRIERKKLLERLDESVSCRFCQGRVHVMENVATKHGLGSTWRIQCENESCPSHKTNSVFNSSEKSRAFEINRASVLGLRAIGGGHSAASKFFSFGGLAPINKNAWADHAKKIEGEANLLLEKELNRASRGVRVEVFLLHLTCQSPIVREN